VSATTSLFKTVTIGIRQMDDFRAPPLLGVGANVVQKKLLSRIGNRTLNKIITQEKHLFGTDYAQR